MYAGKAAHYVALFIFFVGCLYYLFERCHFGNVLFECNVPSPMLTSFPSFVHVFSFSIIHQVYFKTSRHFAVGLWFVINLFFELGQLMTSSEFGVTNLFNSYFVHGQFDPQDIIWAGAGAISAYLLLGKIQNETSK